MYKKKIIKVLLIIFIVFSTLFSQENQQLFKWQTGEELTYKVSWGFIRLGTLHLSIIDTTNIDGVKTYHTQFKIDSNPWLFFINMHSVFDSYLMGDTFPLLFICKEEIDGEEYNSEYRFDYKNKEIVVHYEGAENPDLKIDKRLPMEKQLQDGMSIIFYARANCYKNKKEQLHVIYEAQEGILNINFTGSKDSVSVLFSDDKIPAYYLNGEAHFKAIAGFSGEFEGWFSIDNRRVPLAARMKVFVGSVYIELEKWVKWTP